MRMREKSDWANVKGNERNRAFFKRIVRPIFHELYTPRMALTNLEKENIQKWYVIYQQF